MLQAFWSDKTSSNKQIDKKLYRSADTTSRFGKTTFQLRFPQIINSDINSVFMLAIYASSHRQMTKQSSPPSDEDELTKQLPIRKPIFDNKSNQIKYTWIGHSTAVIAFGDKVKFLIDPVFSQRCSPTKFAGPKRFRDPAVSLQQMPPIDAIFVSHDHYDHLETNALNFFYQKNNKTLFFAGLQSEDVFPKDCKLKTLDWAQSRQFSIEQNHFKVTFVPACHWGKRGVFDKNKRLWGGFVIQGMGKKIFYSGDTGYCGVFKEIGEVFGGFDLSILPIGAYHPRKLLKSQHIDPIQAVKIHQEVKSKKSVGVHWGTFPLGGERYNQAKYDLIQARKEANLKQDEFITVDHGASFTIDCQ